MKVISLVSGEICNIFQENGNYICISFSFLQALIELLCTSPQNFTSSLFLQILFNTVFLLAFSPIHFQRVSI
jgi:hypothetical protein